MQNMRSAIVAVTGLFAPPLTAQAQGRASRGKISLSDISFRDRCRVRDEEHIAILEHIARYSENEGFRLAAIRIEGVVAPGRQSSASMLLATMPFLNYGTFSPQVLSVLHNFLRMGGAPDPAPLGHTGMAFPPAASFGGVSVHGCRWGISRHRYRRHLRHHFWKLAIPIWA